MILSTFRTSVAAELGLDNSASSADQVLIDRWLNQAVRDVLLRTHCYVVSASMTVTAGTADYTLDTAILAIIRASSTTGGGQLEPLGTEQLFELRRRNEATTGDARYYAVLGTNLFLIYPAPSSSGSLTFYYVPKPTEMSSASNDPSSVTYGGIPVEFHQAIELYAFWKGASYDDDASSKIGADYERQYEMFLAKVIRPAVNRKHGARMAPAQVGVRSTMVASRNDVYP